MSKLKAYYEKGKLEACLDESGLGCLAGPVAAAAVIWNPETEDCEELRMINDSKKLTHKKRLRLREYIKEVAIDYAIKLVDVDTIDALNIYHARFLAMHQAIESLNVQPDSLLVDGDKFTPYPYEKIPHTCCVGGDAKYLGIAAASILAKTERDEYMFKLHEKHPEYGWDSNKGYGTAGHYAALKKHGATEHHRKSFNLKI
jgi:ribonuclease HII